MDISRIKTAGITALPQRQNTTEVKQSDNRSVANQTDVVSKNGNEAVRNAALALIGAKGGIHTTPKAGGVTEENKAFADGLKEKYSYDTDEKKAKPAIDKLLSGTPDEVNERLGLYRQVLEKDENISPMDFVSASADLEQAQAMGTEKLSGTPVEQLTKLAQTRHLLGASYPLDFALDMVDLDATFDKVAPKPTGIQGASRDIDITQNETALRFGAGREGFVGDMANLAASAYADPSRLRPERLNGYEVAGSIKDDNGFSATAFKDKDGNIVMAIRGSDDVSDMVSDHQMVDNAEMPEQFANADAFYQQLREQYPDAQIVVTGHSLGGALSQLVAAKHPDAFAVAFNAPGTADIIAKEDTLSDSGNIYNVVVEGDKISNNLAQPGQTQLIEPKTDKYGNSYHPHDIKNCMVSRK